MPFKKNICRAIYRSEALIAESVNGEGLLRRTLLSHSLTSNSCFEVLLRQGFGGILPKLQRRQTKGVSFLA